MKRRLSVYFTSVFVFTLIFLVGCAKDSTTLLDENGEIIPEQGRAIVSGNPDLNDYLITSKEESIYVVDVNTGETLWLNTFFRFESSIPPTVVAQNGVFGTGYFSGN